MNIDFSNKKILFGSLAAIFLMSIGGYFFYALAPISAQKDAHAAIFEIKSGEGFRVVAQNLYHAGLIRSPIAFDIFLLLSGRAAQLKPGEYQLDRAMAVPAMVDSMTNNATSEVTVVVPEGSSIYEVDKILSKALIIHSGDLINFHSDGNIEGRLFPDTYNFFTGTEITVVVQKFLDNFNIKAKQVLGLDGPQCMSDAVCGKNLIIASLLEKEVPDPKDQKVVAGILLKRLKANIYLDLDATICYAKAVAASTSDVGCYPLTPLDFKISSPYNTYLYKGLPPTPIGNPGISAIFAALHPESSSYWYYLSDPRTKKTIFAKTLEEQNRNRQIYLGP